MEHTDPASPPAATQKTPRSGSPHYRRARRDRGAETRAQLIEAALDVFGRLGYEGASTREIAKTANANLAAIVYHFGSKEALYIAVAEHVVASILAKIGPTLAAAADPAAAATPAAARAHAAPPDRDDDRDPARLGGSGTLGALSSCASSSSRPLPST